MSWSSSNIIFSVYIEQVWEFFPASRASIALFETPIMLSDKNPYKQWVLAVDVLANFEGSLLHKSVLQHQ